MRTAILALAGCAILTGMTDQGPVPPVPPQPTITISPIPPRQGEKMTITYTGKLPVTLELDWDPAGTPSSVTIPVGGSATVTVPGNATSLIVADPTPGGASPASTTISP